MRSPVKFYVHSSGDRNCKLRAILRKDHENLTNISIGNSFKKFSCKGEKHPLFVHA